MDVKRLTFDLAVYEVSMKVCFGLEYEDAE